MDTRVTTLRRRTLTTDDLDDVTGLLTASDMDVLGHTDFTAGEIEADLRRADSEAYGWYSGGTLVGYGWLTRVADTARIDLDAYVLPVHDSRLGVDMLAFLEERGLTLAAAAGHDEAVFDIGVYRQDEKTRGWMAERGFHSPTSFVRMRIDVDGPLDPAEPRSGITVRRSDGSESDLRLAHRLVEDSFVEHYGHVETTYERWHERFTERGPDWAEVWLAEVEGEPAGVLVGTPQFEEDENAGYVRTLGTLRSVRGRGVGKALLRAYFHAAQRAGRVAVLLHVDVSNVTGALGVYESVGMRPVLTIDAWTKRRGVTP
ncbi:MAG: GNAT family N-acetyltransferase [Sporichthyaceae bacterium]|nr:GNAT family N-acetyltransferase [Sporichthyaceae bacterium]